MDMARGGDARATLLTPIKDSAVSRLSGFGRVEDRSDVLVNGVKHVFDLALHLLDLLDVAAAAISLAFGFEVLVAGDDSSGLFGLPFT